MQLKRLYDNENGPVVTAHRGFSGLYAENTRTAFLKAVETGVEIVEFDVRESGDGELVVIHDATVDRTTDGVGNVREKTLAELKKLNATYWRGTHNAGSRGATPTGNDAIPTLRETLSALSGKVGLNIQVYTETQQALEKIVSLYNDFKLHDSAFLMLPSFSDAEFVRRLSPGVAICVGDDRSNLGRHLAFGVDFIQPTLSAMLSDGFAHQVKDAGIPANVFYANEARDMELLLNLEVPGIMTDMPDRLLKLRCSGNRMRTQAGSSRYY